MFFCKAFHFSITWKWSHCESTRTQRSMKTDRLEKEGNNLDTLEQKEIMKACPVEPVEDPESRSSSKRWLFRPSRSIILSGTSFDHPWCRPQLLWCKRMFCINMSIVQNVCWTSVCNLLPGSSGRLQWSTAPPPCLTVCRRPSGVHCLKLNPPPLHSSIRHFPFCCDDNSNTLKSDMKRKTLRSH